MMQFFDELDNNPALKEAFRELGYNPYLNELKATQDAFLEAYDIRREQQSKRRKGSTLPIQRELLYVMRVLFDQVDHFQHVYSDIDYSHIISSFNYLIASYNKALKTRITKRTNKKMQAIEDEQAALEEKPKMEPSSQKEADEDAVNLAIEAPMKVDESLEEKLSNTKKRQKVKEKPINGLLDILKKIDKRKREGDEMGDEDD